MIRYLPAILWTAAIYAVTAVTAGKMVVPQVAPDATAEQIRQAWLLFEIKHIVLHAAAYAALAWLLVLPHAGWGKRYSMRIGLMVCFVIAATGVGQELIQALVRWDLRPGNSLLDIVSDSAGAAMAVLVWHRVFARSPGEPIRVCRETRVQ
jgi:hypothetical protein